MLEWAERTEGDVGPVRLIDENRLRVDPDSASGTNYEDYVRDITSEEEGRLFMTEFCSEVDTAPRFDGVRNAVYSSHSDSLGYFDIHRMRFTRLRAIITPEAMDRDVTLTPCYRVYVNNLIFVKTVSTAGLAGNAVIFLPVLVVLLFLRIVRLERGRAEG